MVFKLILFYAIFVTSFVWLNAIPIPNGQLGKAEVECGENDIEIAFLTEDIFQGRIFVVGHVNETKCVSRDIGKRSTSILIHKNECGVVTIRSNNPPGLFVNVKVIISFHDEFITKIDRGYEISCFYMQAEKTVTFPISVSPNKLQSITVFGEMPRCRYEVVDPITQNSVSVVSVGNKLLHRWICDSSAPNLWCMTVHSCFVEDGSGTEYVILNDEGCAIDRYLLDNLEYGPGLLQAQKEAHAFKFADRVVVNFQCSIRLDIKDGECPIPKCPDLSKQRPRINKRSISQRKNYEDTIKHGFTDFDVRALKIDVLDPQIGIGAEKSISKRFSLLNRPDSQHCVPFKLLIAPTGIAGALIISLICVVIYLLSTSARY